MSGIIGTLEKEYLYLLIMKDFKDAIMFKLKLSNVWTFAKFK